MGTNPRWRPERLAEKLLHIRTALSLSQTEMLHHLGIEEEITYKQISKYETGKGEPMLPILLRYAKVANVSVESLIDDRLNLPARLPYKKRRRR